MHVTTLTLCDAASIRENLLSILGGGITILRRPSYPAPLLCDVGVTVHHSANDRVMQLTLTLREAGKSEPLAEIVADGSMSRDPDLPKDAAGSMSLAIDARGIAIPKAGNYVLTASLSHGKGSSIGFTALEAPVPQEPGSVGGIPLV